MKTEANCIKKIKEIIDNYHRNFICNTLASLNLSWDNLGKLLISKDVDSSEVSKIQDSMRDQISKAFKGSKNPTYNDLFSKKMINDILPPFVTTDEEKDIVKYFNKFSTYFQGFYQNRENLYTSDAASTSIAYRIVHENFPKFVSNIRIYRTIKDIKPNLIASIEQSLKNSGLLSKSLDEIFSIESFNNYLDQDGIDYFNLILGGRNAQPNEKKIKGLNEYLNEAMQPDETLRRELKSKRCTRFILLFKQILSDHDKENFIDSFNSDEEVIEALKSFCIKDLLEKKILNSLLDLFSTLKTFDLNNIFIQGKFINKLSTTLFGGLGWSVIRDAILLDDKKTNEFKSNLKKSGDDVEKAFSKESFSVSYICKICKSQVDLDLLDVLNQKVKSFVRKLIDFDNNGWPQSLKKKKDKELIKDLLDTLLDCYRFLHMFSSDSLDRDLNFYLPYEDSMSALSRVVYLYNKVRNYATKKPYTLDKIKLTFENPQLALGWSESKIRDYLTLIFCKDGFYYLGILNKSKTKGIDFGKHTVGFEQKSYKRMQYFLFKSKMIRKCTTALKQVKAHFLTKDEDYILDDKDKFCEPLIITKDIFNLENPKTKGPKKLKKKYESTNAAEFREALSKRISFGKEFLSKYKSTQVFDYSKLKDANEYNDVSEFYNDVDNCSYKIDFEYIDEAFVNKLVDDGNLFLFKIHNKDFSFGSTGTKNLHTLYFENIFSRENLQSRKIKLNGNAELFYRKKSISDSDAIVHDLGSKLVNKLIVHPNGKVEQIPDAIYREISLYANKKLESLSEEAQEYYDKNKQQIIIKDVNHKIVKDRRFTIDKFFLHVPITINYSCKGKYDCNNQVLSYLRNNKDVNIIGIDRGERNLIYITVINQKGQIIESMSFNKLRQEKPNSENYEVDYHDKLVLREKERIAEKRSWESVSKIATLKEGYLSGVIHQLAKLMIKHNAILVLENLNAGFKRVRGEIAERSVYQKFERMLVEKLNYLVFKKNNILEAGGVLNGYQLTPPLNNISDLGLQTGVIFYVPAAYTSKIDPTTGFANVLNLNSVKNDKDAKKFFSSIKSFSYIKEDLFKFSVDFSNTSIKSFVDLEIKCWDIYSYGLRIVRRKNNTGNFQEQLDYSPTYEIKLLLEKYDIDYENGEELLKKLLKDSPIEDKFWKRLFEIFKFILQMRNSKSNSTEDYLISPVKNREGKFFNSNDCLSNLPQDADANGAYHIALKGLIILFRNNLDVKENGKGKKVSFAVSNKDWFRFMQKDLHALNE